MLLFTHSIYRSANFIYTFCESIKNDLNLSDTSLGMLSGSAFALFYATLGIPIAKYVDYGNRRNLISLAIGVEFHDSPFGLAQNFFHLLVARIGVGIGEAGCSLQLTL